MIYVDNKDVNDSDFISLLERTKNSVLNGYSNNIPKNLNGNLFEDYVFSHLKLTSKDTLFDGHLVQTSSFLFPDIIAKKLYGVEVKMTTSDKWTSTGNSVMESTRVDGVERIFMFFGKFGGQLDIKYRRYQECLHEIGVTHSPRYKIDMRLPVGSSIFDKIGIEYDTFRNLENPIKELKKYYRKQLKAGQELWWIDDEIAANPIIQPYIQLDKEVRDCFVSECMILFPEIFSRSTLKFERAAAYLVSKHNAVSSNLRDSFTAGGRMDITLTNKSVNVSRLTYNLYLNAKRIKEILNKIPSDLLRAYWHIDCIGNKVDKWESLINKNNTEQVDIVSVFREGSK